MNCKKCGQEVDKKAVVCTSCGCKIKKPIYKKWWLWAMIVILIIVIGSTSGNKDTVSNTDTNSASNQTEEIVYESVDLQTMFDALDENAMKAEAAYQKKDVQFEGKIKNFDSDGTYISVEPVGADAWNFSTAMCYIKDDAQKEFLMEKSVGDVITIKGKVKSIGEVMGYSVDIHEVS